MAGCSQKDKCEAAFNHTAKCYGKSINDPLIRYEINRCRIDWNRKDKETQAKGNGFVEIVLTMNCSEIKQQFGDSWD